MKKLPRLLGLAAVICLVVVAARAIRHRGDAPPAAVVNGLPISRSQLDRAVAARVRLAGKSDAADRDTALDELIDEALLRGRMGKNPPVVSAAEIDARIHRFEARFGAPADLAAALKTEGVENSRARVAARIAEEKFLARAIAPAVAVTDREAREWFAAHRSAIALPERIEARHVFLSTLDHPSEEAKQRLAAALAELTAGKKDFAALAAEISEDPATMDRGGALGWMTAARLPADFAAPVFALPPGKPTLVRTKLGWHLVEITARKPAEDRDFEAAKAEIVAALESAKRRRAVEDFRKSLRKSARIERFPGSR